MWQKTARTSFPASSASQNVWYKNVSWLTVESPGLNPDWRVDNVLLIMEVIEQVFEHESLKQLTLRVK